MVSRKEIISLSIFVKCMFVLFIFVALTVGCSNSDINNELTRDMLNERKDMHIIENDEESGLLEDQELVQELISISFNSIRAQNKDYEDNLGIIYTDEFIKTITENSKDFYRSFTVMEMSDYPVIFYYPNIKKYEIVMYIQEKSIDSASFQHLWVNKDSNGNFRIFDIQYDG